MTQRDKTNIERLADRIVSALQRGERHFMLEGAELDWIVKLIRGEQMKEGTK
jgi:hypothetical protein